MHKIELIVFDMAGTTVNDEDSVNRCVREALGAAGLDVSPAEVNAVMGIPKPEALRRLVEGHGRLADLGPRLDAIYREFEARSIAFYRTDASVREVAGATDLFAGLKRSGIKVALDTGFNRSITEVVLGRLGWADSKLLDGTVASDEVPRGRPYPDMIHELMRRLRVEDAGRVAKVGDTPADLEEGKNAACGLIIGVTTGTHGPEELEPFPHTHLVESIRDLPGLLGLDLG